MVVGRNKILGVLAPFGNKEEILVADQDTDDILRGLVENHKQYADEYDKISEYFLGADPYQTARNIYDFLKREVPYEIETTGWQTVRSPAAILALPGGDCKHYSLFAAGIEDSLNRKGLQDVPVAYRFASYTWKDRGDPKHVFVVLYPGTDREIWIDPVLSRFDLHKEPMYYKDKKIKSMSLVQISGVDDELVILNQGKSPHGIDAIREFRNRLESERRNRLSAGSLKMYSNEDLEYITAIKQLNKQLQNGGIGQIDPATAAELISAGSSLITSLFGGHKSDPSQEWAMWDQIDAREGQQKAKSAADVIVHNRQDVPAVNIVNYINKNGLTGILANTTYGPITIDTVTSYLTKNGFAAQAQALATALHATPVAPGPSAPVSTGNNDTIWWIGGGIAALFLLPKLIK